LERSHDCRGGGPPHVCAHPACMRLPCPPAPGPTDAYVSTRYAHLFGLHLSAFLVGCPSASTPPRVRHRCTVVSRPPLQLTSRSLTPPRAIAPFSARMRLGPPPPLVMMCSVPWLLVARPTSVPTLLVRSSFSPIEEARFPGEAGVVLAWRAVETGAHCMRCVRRGCEGGVVVAQSSLCATASQGPWS